MQHKQQHLDAQPPMFQKKVAEQICDRESSWKMEKESRYKPIVGTKNGVRVGLSTQ